MIGNVVTDMIDARESDGTVIAGTHGNGVFSATIADPLPVEIASFSASTRGTTALISWSTTTEVNNYGFEIQRSAIVSQASGVSWVDISFVKGSGTSNSVRQYSYSDQPSTAGSYQYRIKMLNQDGSFKYSSLVQVNVGLAPKTFSLFQNYPNPFNPATTIEFTLATDGRAVLKVYDITGREVATLADQDLQAGVIQNVEFDGSRLASGMYLVRLTSNGKQAIKKLTLLK